ncbi:MAG: ABC transporter permease, partial [Fibrobacter sp.]|nr:ABC transporter permease [Fibrobacter sp.]
MRSQSDKVTAQPKVISVPETLDRYWVEKSNALLNEKSKTVVLDFAQTVRIDSAGLCFIKFLHQKFNQKGNKLILRNISSEHLSSLKACNFSVTDKNLSDNSNRNIFLDAGDALLKIYDNSVNALSVLTEMLYWGTFGLLKKQDFKRGTLGDQMYQLGYKAFGIVTLLSFLIGVVLSLQSAIQLRNFGAGVFLAPLIGITMVREMGPLLTAIILAGRTGSATTAEIATMGVGEELDALQTMGINPIQFVVVPKFWAISITMPILSIIATAAGILGGY